MAAIDHLNRAQFPITHEVNGWGAASTNAYGSQQPGWQSGTLHARGPAGESLGHLDYSTMGHLGDRTDVGVADLKVPKQHQRKGVASALMDHLYHEAGPDAEIDHGYQTDQGSPWLRKYMGARPHLRQQTPGYADTEMGS